MTTVHNLRPRGLISRRPSTAPPNAPTSTYRLPQAGDFVTLAAAAGNQFAGHPVTMQVSEVLPALVDHHVYLRGTVDGRPAFEYVIISGITIHRPGDHR